MGRGGTVSLLGEPYDFVRLPLLDRGDGWDWHAPRDMSYWLNDELTFETWNGEWNAVDAIEVCRTAGNVSLGRAVTYLAATGSCLTSGVFAEAEEWKLTVPMQIKSTSVLGSEAATSRVGRTEERVTATLTGVVCEAMINVLVNLPVTKGSLIGVGKVTPIASGIEVQFNSEGVQYGFG